MNEIIMPILKADLQIQTAAIDDYLNTLISSAKEFISREGVLLTDSYEDDLLVEMYAAYLYRKREEGGEMPRMLRFALNNRTVGGNKKC